MFGFFGSKSDRAVDAVATYLSEKCPVIPFPAATLTDPYCVGFIQMLGVHVASQNLPKGSGFEVATAVFEQALLRIAPSHAREVSEALPLMGNNNAYVQGRKDGDFYMGWSLLRIAPEFEAKVASQRFIERVGQ
jgi:hypothetical protein